MSSQATSIFVQCVQPEQQRTILRTVEGQA